MKDTVVSHFHAKITARSASGGTNRYSFEEVKWDVATEAFITFDNARSGTDTVLELTNRLVDVGVYVEMRLGGSSDGTPIYLFAAPDASTGGGGGSGVTAEEADGTPSYTSVLTITFDQADGFVLTQPGGSGTVRIDLASASLTQAGIIDTSAQTLAGAKHIPTASKVYNATSGHTEYVQWSVSESGSTLNAQIDMYSSASDYRGTFGGHYYVTTNSLWFEFTDNVISPASEVFYAIRKAGTLYSGKTGNTASGDTLTGGIITTLYNTPMKRVAVPSTSSSTGTVGDVAFDGSNFYVCHATNTWKRVAVATF